MPLDISMYPRDFYQASWEYINENVVNLSKVLQDYLDINIEKDVNWIQRTDEGGIVQITKPNIAKIINTAISSLRGDITSQPYVLSKTEKEAIRDSNKASYRTAGFITLGSDAYGDPDKPQGLWARLEDEDVLKIGDDKTNEIYMEQTSYPLLHANGYVVHYRNTNNTGKGNVIPMNPINKLTPIIKNSTNVSLNLVEGDRFILADLDRELITNNDWSDDINGWTAINADTTINNGTLTLKPTDTTQQATLIQKVQVVPGVNYEITLNISEGSGIKVTGNRVDLWKTPTDTYESNSYLHIEDSKNVYTFKITPTGTYINIQIRCYIGTTQTVVGTLNLKQVNDQPVVVQKDMNIVGDLYAFDMRANMSGVALDSHQDVVLVETWDEDITASGIDFFHPYGNVQYGGEDVDGLTGITNASFTDADIYSKYSKWDKSGVIGKGYQWSTLTENDKKKILANYNHNIWYDQETDTYFQRKYRSRVIKTILNGIKLAFPRGEETFAMAYNNYIINGSICGKGDKYYNPEYTGGTLLTDNRYKLIYSSSIYLEYPNKIPGFYGTNDYTNNEVIVLPVAVIQRRNLGIFHPIYNPAGTAKAAIKDSNGNVTSLEWYETQDIITRMSDCYDSTKILAVKYDANDNPVYNLLSDADSTYIQSGKKDSKISGREDGGYVDYVMDRDIEDIRPRVNNKSLEKILTEYENNLRSGNLRMSEPLTMTIPYRYLGDFTNLIYRPVFETNVSLYRYNIPYPETDIPYGFRLSSNKKDFKNILRKQTVYYSRNTTGNLIELYNFKFDVRNNTEITYDYGDRLLITKKWAADYKQSKTYTIYELIGDPRDLKNRLDITVTSKDEVLPTLNSNTYILCNNATNNNGVVNHVYRYIGKQVTDIHTNSTDGTANANNGHIDFSDINKWIDLGNDLTIGGYDNEIINNPSIFTLNLNGELYNNYTRLVDYYYNPELKIPFTRHPVDDKFKVLMRTKDGKWKEITITTIDTNNCVLTINLENIYTDFGYNSSNEMIDLSNIIFIYNRTAVFARPINTIWSLTEKDYVVSTVSINESAIAELTIDRPLYDTTDQSYDDVKMLTTEYPYQHTNNLPWKLIYFNKHVYHNSITPRSGFNTKSSIVTFRSHLGLLAAVDINKIGHTYYDHSYSYVLLSNEHTVCDNGDITNSDDLVYTSYYDTQTDSNKTTKTNSRLTIPTLYPTHIKQYNI